MQLSNAPAKIVLPFANSGAKNTIPVTSQIPITPGAASYTDGFPPLTMTPVTAGGSPPTGQDFNGIFNALSAVILYLNGGGAFPYDAAFSSSVGGYPLGARLLRSDGAGYWRSTVDNNTSNPETGGAGWITEGISATSSVYASAQQTLPVGNSKILFDTVEFDRTGLWNAPNQRFIAKYNGLYRMSGAVTLNAPAPQNFALGIFKNGVQVKQGSELPQMSDQDMTVSFNGIVNLLVGDYVEIFMIVTQASVLAGFPGSNQAFVYAQLEYLGQ